MDSAADITSAPADKSLDCIDPSLILKAYPPFEFTVSEPTDDGGGSTTETPSSSSLLPRAHSQPPATHLLRRSPHHPLSRLNRSTSTIAAGQPAHTQRRPPTSAPHLNTEEQWQFMLHQDQTTMTIGVLNHLDRLIEHCQQMKSFVRTGFGEGGESARSTRQVEA